VKYRSDIQGLRAIAVLLVVAHHAFPKQMPGGFIGVDIFFVISGFVISQLLIRDRKKPWREFFLDFYARRVRRILPSALLTIILTTAASLFLLGTITGSDVARDGIFATLFIANLHLNNIAIDYFASGLPQPILQHFWSLAIEEQFYLVWPLLFYLASRKKNAPLIIVGLIALLSFSYAILQIQSGTGTAFFSSLTRIWELAVGSALALIARVRENRAISAVALIVLFGLAFWIKNGSDFPSFSALGVVLTTAALILTSESSEWLKSRYLAYLGDLSYLIYLVHWPVLQIHYIYKGAEATNLEKCMLLALVMLLSASIHRWFENPIRYSPVLVRNSGFTVKLGLAFTAICALSLVLIRGSL
jgi:peptidoglycan/LPS O-acetylase OafA/YrhL